MLSNAVDVDRFTPGRGAAAGRAGACCWAVTSTSRTSSSSACARSRVAARRASRGAAARHRQARRRPRAAGRRARPERRGRARRPVRAARRARAPAPRARLPAPQGQRSVSERRDRGDGVRRCRSSTRQAVAPSSSSGTRPASACRTPRAGSVSSRLPPRRSPTASSGCWPTCRATARPPGGAPWSASRSSLARPPRRAVRAARLVVGRHGRRRLPGGRRDSRRCGRAAWRDETRARLASRRSSDAAAPPRGRTSIRRQTALRIAVPREDVADAGAVAAADCPLGPPRRGDAPVQDHERRVVLDTRAAGAARARGARSPRPSARASRSRARAPRRIRRRARPAGGAGRSVCEMARFQSVSRPSVQRAVGQRPDGNPRGSAACPLMPSSSGRAASWRCDALEQVVGVDAVVVRKRDDVRPAGGATRRCGRARGPGAERRRTDLDARVARERVGDAVVVVLVDDEQTECDAGLVARATRAARRAPSLRPRWQRRGRTPGGVRSCARGYRPSPSAPGSLVTAEPLVSVVLATHDAVTTLGQAVASVLRQTPGGARARRRGRRLERRHPRVLGRGRRPACSSCCGTRSDAGSPPR